MVGILASGDERSEGSGHVLHETGKAFDLRVFWSVVIVPRKKSSGYTNEAGNVGGVVVDTVELDCVLAVESLKGRVQLTVPCV